MKRIFFFAAAALVAIAACSGGNDQKADDDDDGSGGGIAGSGPGGAGPGGAGGMGGEAPSCDPEANSWPANQLPADYNGTGYTVGSQIPVLTNGEDQFGNTDVHMGQFYGGMVLMSFGAIWCGPCQLAGQTSQGMTDVVNASTDEFNFWTIEILVDDADPADTNVADLMDGQNWAAQFGIDFPVLIGQSAANEGNIWGIQALPTYVILDPELRIREIIEGYPGDGPLITAVHDAYAAFKQDNPSWETACPVTPIGEGCGNGVTEPPEECDILTGDQTCRDLTPSRGAGSGLTCSETCTLDTSGCGLAVCSTTGTNTLGYTGTLTCADVAMDLQWDVFNVDVTAGDCVHIRTDNGSGDADLLAFAIDADGTSYGGASDYAELDDEWACTNPPWFQGAGCPEASIVAESTGTMQVGVGQWAGGCATEPAEYSVTIAINGVDIDLSGGPAQDDTANFPPQ